MFGSGSKVNLAFLNPGEKASFWQPEAISLEEVNWKSYCKKLLPGACPPSVRNKGGNYYK